MDYESSKNKISVLVTFYNQEQYVDDALGSVLMQKTSFPFQVIVGDDGSSDSTVEKVRRWQDKYPGRIILNIEERDEKTKYIKGARASRNRLDLLRMVNTPYFIYLDGDDYWTSEKKLQKQYDILEDEKNCDCVGCAHRIRAFHEDSPEKQTYIPGTYIPEKKYKLKYYWKNLYFHTDTVLFRSKYIEKLPYDLISETFNDDLITFCFLQFGSIFYVRDCMVDYRQNQNGIWIGEKKAVSIVREFISRDIELKICPSIESASNRRHLRDYNYFRVDHNAFDGISNLYLDYAEKNRCVTTVRVLSQKHLFTNSWIKDDIKCILIGLKWNIEKVLMLPIRIIRKIKDWLYRREMTDG